MIELKGVILDTSVEQIIEDLRKELYEKGINKLHDAKDTHNNIMVTCPSHGEGTESNPSCGISTVRVGNYPAGTVNCFSCQYRADIEEFISDVFNKNDGGIYGWKWLVKHYVFQDKDNRKINFKVPNRGKEVQDKQIIPEQELDEYRYTHSYMYTRGLTDKIINYFDIGFDKSNNAITFPIRDINGDVIAVQKRNVSTKQFVNMKGVKKNFLYGLYEVYKHINKINEIWVTESVFDCLTCWKYKIPAVATLGTPSYYQIQLLKDCPVRKVVLAFDEDDSGAGFKEKISNNKIDKLLYEVILPEGKKDINECDKCFEQVDKKLYIG